MLMAENLTVEIGSKTLLHNVSLNLQCGERLAVLGQNGAGKSTLLNCLSGSRSQFGGRVLMAGKALQHWSGQQRAQQLAVMPQSVQLSFPLRVWQVVAMGRSPHGDEEQTRDYQHEAMRLTGVWQLRERQYPHLSGGEQQRVQLARVLVQIWEARQGSRPGCLLLDECTSALDPLHQHGVMDIVRDFAGAGTATLAVMHDVALAASWADKVLILKQGGVIAQGDAALLQQPQILQQAYELPVELARRYAQQTAIWSAGG